MRWSRAAIVMCIAGCTFPEVDFGPGGGGGAVGGGTGTSTTATGGAGGGTTTTTAATGGGGSAPTTSGAGGNPCDVDGDTHEIDDATCGGDDCDDADARAFLGQTTPYGSPTALGSYDFDCDGQEEKQYPTSCAAGVPFMDAGVACGDMGQLKTCSICPLTCTNGAMALQKCI